MSEKLRISGEERELLIRGEVETFPKYTSQFLNLANQNAQSTREGYVGNMQDIVTEFDNTHPDGSFEDWVDFYMTEYDGDEKLDRSAEQLYTMVEKMREAIDEIDHEMASRFVRDLVLYKTYMGNQLDVEEAILKKIEQIYTEDIERKENSWVSAYIANVPIVLQSQKSEVSERPGDNVAVVYYRVNTTNSIEVDLYELNQKLGTTITDDDEVHRNLSNFSLSII